MKPSSTAIFSAGAEKMKAALHNPDKHARMDAVAAVKDELLDTFTAEELAADGKDIKATLKQLEKKTMRTMVLEEGERADGRKLDEVRQISCTAGYLPRSHGSGLFTRGQTQVLSVLTLGMLSEWQRLDTIDVAEGKRYIHHYNFPPFSTGETGFMRGPKRRDIGHGALAERALLPVIPDEEDVPLHDPHRLRGSRVQRFELDGLGLRLDARADGRRRADHGAGLGYRDGTHQGG